MEVTKVEKGEEVRGVVEKRKEMASQTRGIKLTMIGYAKPEVTFIGEWDGLSLKAAVKAIKKGYVVRRHKMLSNIHKKG